MAGPFANLTKTEWRLGLRKQLFASSEKRAKWLQE